ncbi:MAG: 50S ribosomal protein L11 methyltransferase [Aridibacter sp.]
MKNKQITWYQVEVKVKAGFEEAIEFAFNELESIGNEINNLGIKSDENICVIGYFNELPSEELIKNHLQTALEIYNFPNDSIIHISTNEIENKDWLAEWKKHWKPTETEKFIIAPPWENVESPKKIMIRIEPNMAFGTGTHETTKLCLRAIEENYESSMSFFDVGTGTGILAIAVAKLRVESKEWREKTIPTLNSQLSTLNLIVGCDTDEDSIKIAKENAILNNITEIEFYIGSISQKTPKFDFVCANVTADVIVPMLPLLLEKSKKMLVLSGILVEQKDLVLNELKKHKIENAEIQTDGEWISITIKIYHFSNYPFSVFRYPLLIVFLRRTCGWNIAVVGNCQNRNSFLRVYFYRS